MGEKFWEIGINIISLIRKVTVYYTISFFMETNWEQRSTFQLSFLGILFLVSKLTMLLLA